MTPEAHNFAASETHIFRANLINEARIGYQETRETQHINSPRLFDQYGVLGAPDISIVHGLPTFAVAGFATLGTTGPGNLPTPATGSGNLPIDKQGRTIQAADNLSWVRGRHTVKFGFDFQQVTLYANSTLQARPNFNFTGVYTQNPQSRPGTGASFADFLLGLTNDSQVSTRSISESRQHIYQGYVQDDWNITPRLTLNLGLRYELPLPFYETANKYANLILEPGSLYGQLLDAHDAGAAGYRTSFVDPNWHNFAPRVGFAFKLTPKTVIRSAAGIFYGRDENVPVARRPTNNPPYFILSTYTSDQIDPSIVLSQGFPANALDPANVKNPAVNSYLRHSPTPYVQQWNFNVQRELPAGLVAQVAYVGSSSHDLYYPDNVNLPPPGAGKIQPRRPIQGFAAIYEYAPFVSANYNALQAQLERRFSKGLTFLAAYTYSHSLDNGPSQADNGVGDPGPQNPLNFTAERGNSNFDVRQRFVASTVYELPFGTGKPFLSHSRLGRAIAGGWQFSGILSLQSGLPFTPVLSFDPTNSGTTARPIALATATCHPAGKRRCIGSMQPRLPSRPPLHLAVPGATSYVDRDKEISTWASPARFRSASVWAWNFVRRRSICSTRRNSAFPTRLWAWLPRASFRRSSTPNASCNLRCGWRFEFPNSYLGDHHEQENHKARSFQECRCAYSSGCYCVGCPGGAAPGFGGPAFERGVALGAPAETAGK